jgi:hypothetical protein
LYCAAVISALALRVKQAVSKASANFDTRIVKPSIRVAKAAIVGESGDAAQKRSSIRNP